jgi:hypothetical protein
MRDGQDRDYIEGVSIDLYPRALDEYIARFRVSPTVIEDPIVYVLNNPLHPINQLFIVVGDAHRNSEKTANNSACIILLRNANAKE